MQVSNCPWQVMSQSSVAPLAGLAAFPLPAMASSLHDAMSSWCPTSLEGVSLELECWTASCSGAERRKHFCLPGMGGLALDRVDGMWYTEL
jgi:hypothetical protein